MWSFSGKAIIPSGKRMVTGGAHLCVFISRAHFRSKSMPIWPKINAFHGSNRIPDIKQAFIIESGFKRSQMWSFSGFVIIPEEKPMVTGGGRL